MRSSAFVRKELVEILRQPRLLGLLVLGPFLLLLLFGAGYAQNGLVLRAVFVGPADSVYEEVLATYEADLGDFIESQGYTTSETDARATLRNGETDVIVVFPDDAVETVLAGEQAEIRVIHDEIDPLQQTAIWVVARLAVQELNTTVLSTIAGEVQDVAAPATEVLAVLSGLADELEAADGDTAAVGEVADRLIVSLRDLGSVVDGSLSILGRLDPESAPAVELDAVATRVRELRERVGDLDGVDAPDTTTLASDLRTLSEQFDAAIALDPMILVRPFVSSTENALPQRITPSDYFTPAALALLLQHVGVTFAALSLVRDRSTGLFELLRVSPLSATEILIGKCIAYLVLGGTVAAALFGASVLGLGVPMAGSVLWLAVMVGGVLLGSLALGMVLSLLSGTESQAVQWAMLSLLAGLFFGGFVLSIEDLAFPVSIISWVLPVTYGIRSFQDVMFRGIAPQTTDLIGLGALIVVYGTVAVIALRSKLRIA